MRRPSCRAVWEARKAQYPHQRTTQGVAGAVRPEGLDPTLFGGFLRVPFAREGVVRWGFLTEAAAALFDQRLGAVA